MELTQARRAVEVGTKRHVKTAFSIFLLLCPLTLLADAESDLRNAVGDLARNSYAWETTVRQRFNGETAEPKLNLDAAIEVRGRTDPRSYTEITLMPSKELAAPVMAVSRSGDVVGNTPVGWLRRTEMRTVPEPSRMVEFGGKQVRLDRVIKVALQVTARRTPAEDLLDMIADLKSFRSMESLVVAEMRDQMVEKLWGDAQAKRAPEIQGTVIFKLTDAGLAECHLVIAIGFPNSRTKKVAWSMQQWTTRFTEVGTASVEPAAAAMKALEE